MVLMSRRYRNLRPNSEGEHGRGVLRRGLMDGACTPRRPDDADIQGGHPIQSFHSPGTFPPDVLPFWEPCCFLFQAVALFHHSLQANS